MATELDDQNERWNRAWFDKDDATVERLMADDYLYVAPTGFALDRDAILRIIRAPTYRVDRGTHTEVTVRMLGEGAAMIRHHWKGEGSFEGKAFADDQWGVRIWEFRSGAWRLVFEQSAFYSP
jgi:hypothetical protein